jgi:tripartite-type tricarboxylate transporter receptor subunit TctC
MTDFSVADFNPTDLRFLRHKNDFNALNTILLKSRVFLALSLIGGLITIGSEVFAQTLAKPIKLVVPYPPGGIADALAREIAVPLAALLGQQTVVENKAGAAGALGATLVKNAEPDGNTLLFTNVGPSAIAPAMSKATPYDPNKDFTAVSLVSRSPLMLVASARSEIKDIRGLLLMARAKPDGLAYSSAGMGSFGHLSTELLAQAAGVKLLHVPYQGQAPATLALVSGDVQISLTAPSSQMLEMVREGRFRLLGVSTKGPSSLVPGAPPIADTIPGFDAEYWFGIVAPAGTSEAVVARLDAAIQKILLDANLVKRFQLMGNEPAATSTPAQFQKLIESEAKRWRDVVKTTKLN